MVRGAKLKRMLLLLIVCFAWIAFSGCSTHMAFTYPMNPPIRKLTSEPAAVKIAVLPTKDGRRANNRSATMSFYWVPLMPFGWVDYYRPEASRTFNTIGMFNMDMEEDLAQAIAFHWQEAGVAKRVFFDFGGMVDQVDYVLESTLKESHYHGKIFTYGLSFIGPVLWVVGLPTGHSKVKFNLQLELKDRNGDVVWRDSIVENWSIIQGLYYNKGRDMEGLSINLQRGLDKSLRRNPPLPAGQNPVTDQAPDLTIQPDS